VVIIDPRDEYDGIIVNSFEDFVDYIKDKDEFKIVCRYESDIDIDYTFKAIFVIKNILLVVEEAEIYISPLAKQSSFLTLVRYGRHKNIKIIGIARRASELSIDFRAMTDKIISFKQTEIRDLDALEKLGFKNLNQLGEHEYQELTL